MQPKIINVGKLHITGLTGNGSKTGDVWSNFDCLYNAQPFDKADESGYEIRFWQNRHTGKSPDQTESVHVGFLTEQKADSGNFSTVELPASAYAVFEVYVVNGYDSGNAEMEQWLADNAEVYSLREHGGYEYVIECYNEKFKGGVECDSVVEFWIPISTKE